MSEAKISVLSDNKTSSPNLGCEWGLCFAVELYGRGFWLWDTGASDMFIQNAKQMGMDLAQTNGVMLSHGHYDHTGGLAALIDETGFSGPIYAHNNVFISRYLLRDDKIREIGMKTVDLPRPIPEVRPVQDVRRIAPGLTMIASISRRPGMSQSVDGFYLDTQGKQKDRVIDDSCLVFESGSARALILGCCHSGLGNTMTHLKEELGYDSFTHVLGGMHLYTGNPAAVDEAVEFLREFQVESIRPSHCTGDAATEILANKFPGKVRQLRVGETVEI